MLKRLALLLLLPLGQPLLCLAYDDETTHPALTQEIISYYESLPGAKALSEEEKDLIIEGSRLEDTAPRWVNHFYDPIHETGWTGARAGSLTPKQAVSAAMSGFNMPDPLPSPVWARDFRTQLVYKWYGGDHTFESAMQSWIKDDKKAAYLSLGYLLHLLEDLSVPEHARDDTHSGRAGDFVSLYENYAKRWTTETLPSLRTSQNLKASGVALPTCRTLEECFKPLALYTSTHFFSRDTINDIRFEYPKIIDSDAAFAYGSDEVGQYPLAKILCAIPQEQKTCEQYYVLDETSDDIFKEYFSRLSKKAVLYGAAFIRYFDEEARTRYDVRDIGPLYSIDWSFITAPGVSLIGLGQSAADGLAGAFESAQNLLASSLSYIQSNVSYVWQAGLSALGDSWSLLSFWDDDSSGGDTVAISNTPSSSSSSGNIVLGEVAGQSIRRPPVLAHPASAFENASDTQNDIVEPVQYSVLRVIDGDTIVIMGGSHVRYTGIDAPEMPNDGEIGDCLAEESRHKNEELIDGRRVTLEKASQDVDDYGRLVRYVYVDGVLINEMLVAEGFARAYDFGYDHPFKARFKEAEKKAKELSLGIWSDECVKKDARAASSSAIIATSTSALRINELATIKGEFVELLNTGKEKISLRNYWISYYSSSRRSWADPYRSFELPSSTQLDPGAHYVVGFEESSSSDFVAYTSGTLGNLSGAVSLFEGNPSAGGSYVDGVGWGDAYLFENRVAATPPYGGAIGRREGSLDYDTQDNRADFVGTYKTTPKEKNILLVSAPSSGGGTGSMALGPMPDIIINEVMYDPRGADTGHEWIEIVNRGNTSVDMTKMKLYESSSSHSIVPWNTTTLLPGGSFAIICSATSTCIPDLAALGYLGGVYDSTYSLSNTGETIELRWGVSMASQATWTASSGANGNGKSYQRFEDSWKATAPTPGRENEYVHATNTSPVAQYTYSAGYAGASSTFNAASSSDAESDIVSFAWDFGDGATSSGQMAQHSYSTADDFEVLLTVEDSDGATSSATSSLTIVFAPEDSTGVKADHVVISEIQVAGADSGDEFIELYNPTLSSVDMSTWSIQYASAGGSFSKKNFPPGAIIPAQGFYLVARAQSESKNDGYAGSKVPDLSHRSFSLSGLSAGGRIFLASHQETISLPSLSGVVDSLNYSFRVPSEGKSLERKAFKSTGCVSPLPQSEGEFIGNACVHPLEKDDYVLRNTPNPQNSASLPEPRSKPEKPQTADGSPLAAYSSSTLRISLVWKPYAGTSTSVTVRDTSVSPSVILTQTQSSTYAIPVEIVGKSYDFSLVAADTDGYQSDEAIVSVNVPSFLTRMDFAQSSPTASATLDLFYTAYPFIPDIYSRDYISNSWQAMVFYLNREANASNTRLIEPTGYEAADKTGILITKPSGYTTQQFALQGKYAPGYGGGLYSSAFLLPTEDGHLRITLPKGVTYAEGDYITVAYYDYYNALSSDRPLRLVATDATHYSLLSSGPQWSAPSIPALKAPELNDFRSELTISWDAAADPDSEDSRIEYEVGATTSTDESQMIWTKVDTQTSYALPVVHPNTYLIGVRAYDTDGTTSAAATTTWNFPAGYEPLAETRYTNAISQVFVAPASADIAKIEIYSPRYNLISGRYINTCNVGIYSVTDTGVALIANGDLTHPGDGYTGDYAQRGRSCTGLPVPFTYDSTHPHIEAGGKYMWYFKVEGSAHTQSFSGIGTDKAGGSVAIDAAGPPASKSPGATFQNAIFILTATDGSTIYTWK